MAAAARRKLTEYLDLEVATGVKHEFADGEAYAMAGASIAHADLVGSAFALLEQRLRVPVHNRSY